MKTVRIDALMGMARDKAIPSFTVFFCVTAVALLLCLVYVLCVPYDHSIGRAGAHGPLPGEPLPAAEQAEHAPVREEFFVQKKLFEGQRAPSGKPAANTQGGASLVLLGVSLGDKKVAVIRNESDKKDYYVSEGETMSGFQVRSIDKNKVVLDSGGKTVELAK
ncbi:MAG: hypothetical protein ACM3OC_02910 [Deltaproteobacteria bacterium]